MFKHDRSVKADEEYDIGDYREVAVLELKLQDITK